MSAEARGVTHTPALVGPVLRSGPDSAALIEAIRARNSHVEVIDRGAYLRVVAPHRLILEKAAAETALGRGFVLPGELELVMVSFSGRLSVSSERAEWSAS